MERKKRSWPEDKDGNSDGVIHGSCEIVRLVCCWNGGVMISVFCLEVDGTDAAGLWTLHWNRMAVTLYCGDVGLWGATFR